MKKTLLQGLRLLVGATVVTISLFTGQRGEVNVAFGEVLPPTIVSAFQKNKPERTDNSFLVAQAANLSGVWNCNDGGIYFVRQVGNELWWYGQSSDGGTTWSNVFRGVIRGNQVFGQWADVPKGSVRGYGEMVLLISNTSHLDKISGGQNFGGSVWSR